MPKQKAEVDYFAVQGKYYGEWEDLTACETLSEAKDERITYDINEPEIPHRIQKVYKSGKRITIVQD